MTNFFKELSWRGMLHTHTPGVEQHLAEKQVSAYIGFDPTASSLHVGSLLPIMGLVHFQRAGHVPIAIAGGGTGMIGDPSGKTQERKLLSMDILEENLIGIKAQLSHFLDFGAKQNPARLVNNAEWLVPLSAMEFLRDVGKFFSVNEMLAKDSVKNRIGSEQGMSFTEFSYSLLQAYDYLKLFDQYGCTLQMGGSDQWGNILAGADLIRKRRGAEAHAIVYPLITTSSGVKFGKTEGGTIWLDASRTSPYKFYQFWYNTDDKDVPRYLRFFTLLDEAAIAGLEHSLQNSPEKREAQTALATEVTRMVHGEDSVSQVQKASRILFGGEIENVSEQLLLDIFADVPSIDRPRAEFEGEGVGLLDLMAASGLVASKGEARRLVQGGGVSVNNRKEPSADRKIVAADALHGKFIVLRKGGKSYALVKLAG